MRGSSLSGRAQTLSLQDTQSEDNQLNHLQVFCRGPHLPNHVLSLMGLERPKDTAPVSEALAD